MGHTEHGVKACEKGEEMVKRESKKKKKWSNGQNGQNDNCPATEENGGEWVWHETVSTSTSVSKCERLSTSGRKPVTISHPGHGTRLPDDK